MQFHIATSRSYEPLLEGEIPEFRHPAPVALRHEGDEDLGEVNPGDEEGERDHEDEEDLLVEPELPDVRQQLVEIHVLGLDALDRHDRRDRLGLSGVDLLATPRTRAQPRRIRLREAIRARRAKFLLRRHRSRASSLSTGSDLLFPQKICLLSDFENSTGIPAQDTDRD